MEADLELRDGARRWSGAGPRRTGIFDVTEVGEPTKPKAPPREGGAFPFFHAGLDSNQNPRLGEVRPSPA